MKRDYIIELQSVVDIALKRKIDAICDELFQFEKIGKLTEAQFENELERLAEANQYVRRNPIYFQWQGESAK